MPSLDPPSSSSASTDLPHGLSSNVTSKRNPRFTIQHVTPADIPTYVSLQFATFNNPFTYEPYHEVLYPGGNTPSARAKAEKRLLHELETDKQAIFLKCVDRETGKMAGGARWAVHHENPVASSRWVEAGWVETGLGGFGGEEAFKDQKAFTEHVVNAVYGCRDKATEGKPYVVLEVLFCDAAYQRQGVGQHLMDFGVSLADQLGYQSIIESTISGKRLYEKNGYTATQTWMEVPEKWFWRTPIQFYLMHRDAGGLKQVEENAEKIAAYNWARS